MRPAARTSSAFSLVELSIVLVILGLLTGGILSGQSLIHAAKLRKLTTSIVGLTASAQAFRDRYFLLPGDLNNATAFWGAANSAGAGGQCANTLTNAGTGTQTCNGNGNAQIDGPETYRFWQHLANAGLIEGRYTGVIGNDPYGGYHDVAGENMMAMPGGGPGGIKLKYIGQSFLDTYYSYSFTAGNFLTVATYHNTFHTLEGGILKPEDAWNLDQKIDDGKPLAGAVQIMKGYWSGCTTASSVTATYQVSSTDTRCMIVMQFI